MMFSAYFIFWLRGVPENANLVPRNLSSEHSLNKTIEDGYFVVLE